MNKKQTKQVTQFALKRYYKRQLDKAHDKQRDAAEMQRLLKNCQDYAARADDLDEGDLRRFYEDYLALEVLADKNKVDTGLPPSSQVFG